MKQTKRILAINDLSGHSHTSLLAVIPIASAMGIGVTAMPTAVLSSNTEQPGFRMIDLTPHLEGFLQQWKDLALRFDAIYSGFLSSPQQVRIVEKAIGDFEQAHPLVVVDPVMADNGELYACFDSSIIASMQSLVPLADMITPNLTEAALLLGEPYQSRPSPRTVKAWCRRLAELGPDLVLITNVPLGLNSRKTSVIAYDRKRDKLQRTVCRYLPVDYPGTGDIFTCVLTCLLLHKLDFFRAITQTVRFVSRAMELTLAIGTPAREGICLERTLRLLPKV
jgi:pyridoxine kinase